MKCPHACFTERVRLANLNLHVPLSRHCCNTALMCSRISDFVAPGLNVCQTFSMIRANRSRYTVFRHDLFELYSLNQARVLVVVFFFGCGRFLTKGLLGILG